MKLADAKKLMKPKAIPKEEVRFFVHFEKLERGCLATDYFPEQSERAIKTQERAWDLARKFAETAPPEYVNIYVVDARFRPVEGYGGGTLRRHART